MATTADNVRVGVTGAVYTAPAGTTLPTDATAVPAAEFDEVGFVTEDGITLSISEDITDLKAWQNGTVVRKLQTSHDVTVGLSMMETSDVTLETYFGSTSGEITADQLPHRAWIIDVVDGDDVIRWVIPDGQVTERGDISIVNADSINYPITISCFPDETEVKVYRYDGTTGS